VPIGELAGSDHDGVLAPIAVESQQLAQALDHREVRLLPSVVGRCPVPVKPRGTVAIGVGRDYIWTMDETELTRRLGQPDNIIGREERMRSLGWVCSTCRNATANVVPMPCPAPCAWCGGIAFEMVDPPAQ